MQEKIVVDIVPVPKPRMTRSDKWKKRKCVVDYFKFKDEIKKVADKFGFGNPAKLHISFYVPVPKSWSSKKQKEYIGKPHQSRGDIDNYAKAVLDSLYSEDSIIYYLSLEKTWSKAGRIEIKNIE